MEIYMYEDTGVTFTTPSYNVLNSHNSIIYLLFTAWSDCHCVFSSHLYRDFTWYSFS